MTKKDEEHSQRAALPRCTQPHCLLQQPGFDATGLAELVVQTMVDGEAADPLPHELLIERREVCRDCVERVMEGRAPYWTDEQREEEEKKLADAGTRSYRRQRRRG